jgi:hypothetical protein
VRSRSLVHLCVFFYCKMGGECHCFDFDETRRRLQLRAGFVRGSFCWFTQHAEQRDT